MHIVTASELLNIATCIFVAAGAPERIARRVAESLVLSNLMGVDSHGVMRIPQYLSEIKAGGIVPDATPRVVRERDVVAVMDGQNSFGQFAAEQAMRLAIQKAKEHTVGLVTLDHVLHVGRAGEWPSLAAAEGLFGLILVNGSRPGGLVAPYGSRQRLLGTNPIAFAIPSGSRPPVVGDYSTAEAAEGRVRLMSQKGASIPLGWVINKEGRPTTNPADLYDGGALQPFGGHKGYGLSLMIEALAGILSGGNTPIFPENKRLQNGAFMLALDVTFFRPGTEFYDAADFLFGAVKHSAPAEGLDCVLLPGEPELRRKAERERDGIPLDDGTWTALQRAATDLNITL